MQHTHEFGCNINENIYSSKIKTATLQTYDDLAEFATLLCRMGWALYLC